MLITDRVQEYGRNSRLVIFLLRSPVLASAFQMPFKSREMPFTCLSEIAKCLSRAFHLPFTLPFTLPFKFMIAFQKLKGLYWGPVITGFGAVYPADERKAGFSGAI